MSFVRVARHAMATRFEMLLEGEREPALRAAGEEALDEIERLDVLLSAFNPASAVSRINALAARSPVRIDPELHALLRRARQWTEATAGAFDITVAPLLECWGFRDGQGHVPDPAALEHARTRSGMQHVELDTARSTVFFQRQGTRLDLGSIGKGYAIERAGEILREHGVRAALIHGGTSTVLGIGQPSGQAAWSIAVESPATDAASSAGNDTPEPKDPERPLALIPLHDEALSVSAGSGRCFTSDGRSYGHVMDPRTGEPTRRALLAAIRHRSATDTDALSTALLVLGADGLELLARCAPDAAMLVVTPASDVGGTLGVHTRGLSMDPAADLTPRPVR
jgi:thiamine biosynthesis lipoprotein